MKKAIISIEGNIGSGKSTLISKLRNLNDNKDIIFLDEPVDEWLTIKDEDNNDILSKFYSDQNKYSFSFQMMAYISRLNKLKQALRRETNIILTERSLSTDKYVFAKMLYDTNKLDSCEYQIYNKWFDSFNEETEVTHIIYVKTDPENCFNRIEKRSRTGENKITKEYLLNCHNYHENMINIKNKNIPILELDGNLDIFDESVLHFWMGSIKSFISRISFETKSTAYSPIINEIDVSY